MGPVQEGKLPKHSMGMPKQGHTCDTEKLSGLAAFL